MRTQIVDAVLKRVAASLAPQAEGLAARDGNIIELLLGAGFPARAVLDACTSVSGLPPAPGAWLTEPRPPVVPHLDAGLCRRLGAAPLASVAGRLCIGFSDPEVAKASDKLGLPIHTAYLALPDDLKKALAALPDAQDDAAPTRLQPLVSPEAPPADGRTDSAEGATVTMPSPPTSRFQAPRVSPVEPPGSFGFDPSAPDAADDEEPRTVSADLSALARGTSEAGRNVSADLDEETMSADLSALAREPHIDNRLGQPVEPPPTPGPFGFDPSAPDPDDDDEPRTVSADLSALARATSEEGRNLSADLDEEPRTVSADLSALARDSQIDNSFDEATAAVLVLGGRSAAARATTASDSARALADADDDPDRDEGRTELFDRPASQMAEIAAGLDVATTPSVQVPPAIIVGRAPGPDIVTTPVRVPREVSDTSQLPPAPGDDGDEFADAATRVRPFASGPGAGGGAPFAMASTALDEGGSSPGRATAARPTPASDRPRAAVAVDSALDDGSLVDIIVAEPEPASAASTPRGAVGERDARIAQLQVIKRYRVERLLGRGGMASVYAAVDTTSGRLCALKVLEPHLVEDPLFVERFRREVRASRALEHENIVRTWDAGEEHNACFMASELVDGGTVQALVRALPQGAPSSLVVPLLRGLLAGLQHAHAAGIIHRDLKPANLLLTSEGVLKIGDFGIGKNVADPTITRTGALFGTPAYMSPEQAQGLELDGRSDLFGAGIVAYELLTGANPFVGESPGATMMNVARGWHADVRDVAPHVPLALGELVERLLARDRTRRFASAGEALGSLAPLANLVERRAPDAVARALADVRGGTVALAAAEAKMHASHAAFALEKAPPEPAEAAFHFHCAAVLDPANEEVTAALSELVKEYGFRLAPAGAAEVATLEAAFREEPESTIARRLLQIAEGERALLDVARWARALVALEPQDIALQVRLERVIGTDGLAPFSAPGARSANSTLPQTVVGRAARTALPGTEILPALPTTGSTAELPPSARTDPPLGGHSPSGGTPRPDSGSRPRLRDVAALDPSMPAPGTSRPRRRPEPTRGSAEKGFNPSARSGAASAALVGALVVLVVLLALVIWRSAGPAAGAVVLSPAHGKQTSLIKASAAELDASKAIKLLGDAIDLDAEGPAAREALMLRARRYESMGEFSRAVSDYKGVLKQAPTDPQRHEAETAIKRIAQTLRGI